MPEFIVPEQAAHFRLDQFLATQLPQHSRSRLASLIKEKRVLLDGAPAKPAEKLHPGQHIAFEEPQAPAPTETAAEELPLDILFEDADLIVLNKAPGMVVHPAAGNWSGTLVNALLHHCPALSSLEGPGGIGGEARPGIVHRLDKETSGCIVIAKNDTALHALSRQFAQRTVLKIYLALARGLFAKKAGVIETAIGRHPVDRKKMAVTAPGKGRHAITDYRILREFPAGLPGFAQPASLVECTLHTGRTHQIRIHLKHLGHPLLGDSVYGPTRKSPEATLISRQMLHAWKLGFDHPRTGQRLQFQAALPGDFTQIGATP